MFAFNQAHGGQEIGYPPSAPEGPYEMVDTNIVGPDETPTDHFYNKLLKVYGILCAQTAKALGRNRHAVMVEFLKRYREEVDEVKIVNEEPELPFGNGASKLA